MKWKENIIVLLLATAAAFSSSMATAWAANESCMGCHEPHDNCARCHVIPDHHSNDNATVGNCEYCHADPRGNPDLAGWNVPAIGDNGHNSGSSYPTQLACRECHVSYSNGEMIISRFSRSDYNKYTTDYTKGIAHTIPNLEGRINNYGICFSCHDGIRATAVTVWHARPDKHSSQWIFGKDDAARCTGSREVWDPVWPPPASLARYLPGRSSGTIGRFNLFNVPGFGYIPGNWDYDACSDAPRYQTTVLDFKRIDIPPVTGNGNTSGSVPVFPSLYRLTPDGEVIPPPPEGSMALPGDYSFTFNYIGPSAQTLDIPLNATDIQFMVKGAGGGGGRPDNAGLETSGKPGSMVVVPSGATYVTLTIYVAGGGQMGSTTSAGAPGGWGYPSGLKGGYGDDDGDGWAYGGAGGGGASAIYLGETKLAEAAGGAGGRSDDWYDYDDFQGGYGGKGGGMNYYPSGTVSLTGGGAGGTTVPTSGGNGQVVITYRVPWD